MNQAHAELYGFDDPADLLGRSWRACYRQKTIDRFEESVLPALAETDHWQGELSVTAADGREFDQELNLTRLEDGTVVCVVRAPPP